MLGANLTSFFYHFPATCVSEDLVSKLLAEGRWFPKDLGSWADRDHAAQGKAAV